MLRVKGRGAEVKRRRGHMAWALHTFRQFFRRSTLRETGRQTSTAESGECRYEAPEKLVCDEFLLLLLKVGLLRATVRAFRIFDAQALCRPFADTRTHIHTYC